MAYRKCSFGALWAVASLISVDGFSVLHRSDLGLIPAGTTREKRRLQTVFKLSNQNQETVAVDTLSQRRHITARSVAAHALLGEKKGQPSLQQLEFDPSFTSLEDQRDRSFARLLVTTVERRLGQIDKVLEQCQSSNRPKQKVTSFTRLLHEARFRRVVLTQFTPYTL